MAFGLGFGIGFCRRFGAAASNPGTIEGTPVSIAQGVDGETLADVVTWGSMTATVGTLGSPVREMRLNAGSWATYVGTTALVHPDEWDVRESWESTSGATRTDTAGPMTVVGAPSSSFPQILSHADTVNSNSGATTTVVTMPGTFSAGDTLLAFVTVDGNVTLTATAGWTVLENNLGPSFRRLVLTKVAAGSDTLTVDHGGAGERSTAKALALTAGSLVTLGTVDASADAPALTYGSSADTLWLVYASHDGTATDVATGSPPTDYAFLGAIAKSGTSTADTATHVAYRELSAASENPGAFSVSAIGIRVQAIGVRF